MEYRSMAHVKVQVAVTRLYRLSFGNKRIGNQQRGNCLAKKNFGLLLHRLFFRLLFLFIGCFGQLFHKVALTVTVH